jgi:hypothetical protein
MTLAILQWREYGDDEDSLSVHLIESQDDDDDYGFDAARRLAKHEAEVNGLLYREPDEAVSRYDDEKGHLMIINMMAFKNGEVITAQDERKFIVRFEEVTE